MQARETHFTEVADWKLDLARYQAYRLGFRGADLDDAVQEVALLLLQFRYDPEQFQDATEQTVVNRVICNRLHSIRRSESRYQGRLQHLQSQLDEDSEIDESQSLDHVDACECVAAVVAELSEFDQQVCSLLMDGESLAGIARVTRRNWHTVQNAVDRIRDQFRRSGLGPALPSGGRN